MKKVCLVIVGPTAVGKTAYAIEIAKQYHTEIISADSRQCYRELNIGVGKPSTSQLQEIKHYFINSHYIHQEVHAALYERYSLEAAEKIFKHHDIAVMVGGTGLYINAFCEGMDEVPLVNPEVRAKISENYKELGLDWLRQQVAANDPAYFNDGEILNPSRLIRALEVKLSTGHSIRTFQTREKKKRTFSIVKIGLELEKQVLHRRINQRVDEMAASGLGEEVRNLLPFRHLNALNTVGYKEFFDHFDGQTSYDEVLELIKLHTRHYAKRQITWFKKDATTKWIHPDNFSVIKNLLQL